MLKGATASGSTKATVAGSSSHRWSIILGGAIIVLAALAAYHNSFVAPFLLDDVPSITRNPSIHHLWPLWGPLSPPHGTGWTVDGRPVVNLTLAINYAVGGVTPWGYHALNLAIHILAGLTLFGVMSRTLLSPVLRGRFDAVAMRLALTVAVLWTVHPLQTEAVTYVVQRCESLMGLFYLLTLYCFIRGAESATPGRWYALSVAACLLGMGSKEVMVSAPLMVLLYDWMFVAGDFREVWKRRWRLYAGLAGTWVLLGYLVANTGNRGGSAGFGTEVAWLEYALTQCRAVVQYLKLSVWPYPLVFDYGTATVRHVGQALPYAVVLTALAVGTVISLWRRRAIGFLGVWFFAILAPSSSVVPVAAQTMAEHRMYLPLAAVVTLVVMGIYTLMGRRSTIVFLALAVGLGFLTTRRNDDYRTELSIWNDTVAKCPDNSRAHSNLSRALLLAGRLSEAMAECEPALQANPNNPEAHYNFGFILQQMGRTQEAIGEYERTLRLKPDFADAHYNLAVALEKVGREPEAIEHYEQALRSYPDYVEARVNLGSALLQMGKVSEAIAQYEQALRINPDYAEAHGNLGAIFQRMGKLPEAAAQYEQALRIKPDYVEAHFNLGLALEKLGRVPEAIEHYQQALKLRPDFAPAKNALMRLQPGP
jgi:tetratricopeptide (TPR) repeat protein